MSDARNGAAASTMSVVAAFAAVYLIWGSTYLGIRYAIETIPPFLMAGVRVLIAGGILYVWARRRGAPRPTRVEWRAAAVIGVLLLTIGNGAVTWAEQYVASGVAALLVAIVPFWMVLFEWLRPGGVRPTLAVIVGLVMGFGGLGLLIGPGEAGGTAVHLVGAAVLVSGSIAWAAGSIYSRTAPLPSSPILSTAMEMLAGGVALVVLGLAAGEGVQLELARVSPQSLLALFYLIVFGSLIGYTAYVWLLQVSTPARVSTYAYVNPVVAVFLGWALAGEPLTPRVLIATAVIVGSVVVITLSRGNSDRPTAVRPRRGVPRTKSTKARAA